MSTKTVFSLDQDLLDRCHERAPQYDRENRFFQEDFEELRDAGYLLMTVPEELGGRGGDLATTLLTLEGLGYGCRDNGLAFAVASQMLSTQIALVRFASPDLQERWLPPLVEGTALGAFGMTEVETGSDAFSISTTAERLDDGSYRLTGEKRYLEKSASQMQYILDHQHADGYMLGEGVSDESGQPKRTTFDYTADFASWLIDNAGEWEARGL